MYIYTCMYGHGWKRDVRCVIDKSMDEYLRVNVATAAVTGTAAIAADKIIITSTVSQMPCVTYVSCSFCFYGSYWCL